MIGCVKVMFGVDIGICVFACVEIVLNIVLVVMFMEIGLLDLMTFLVAVVFTTLPAVAPSVIGVSNRFVCDLLHRCFFCYCFLRFIRKS